MTQDLKFHFTTYLGNGKQIKNMYFQQTTILAEKSKPQARSTAENKYIDNTKAR